MRTKRKILSLVLAGACVLGLAGCGPKTSNQDDNLDNYGPEATGTFELQIYAGGYGTEMWEYVLEEFEKDHPNVEVVPYMDNNVNTQMASRWRNGNPPDFVFLDGSGLDKDAWLSSGLLYDVSDWLKTAKVQGSDTKITDVVDSKMFNYYTEKDGTKITYGMPLLKNSYGVWYDEAWMEENQLSYPHNYTQLMEFSDSIAASGAKTDGDKTPAVMCYPGLNAPG